MNETQIERNEPEETKCFLSSSRASKLPSFVWTLLISAFSIGLIFILQKRFDLIFYQIGLCSVLLCSLAGGGIGGFSSLLLHVFYFFSFEKLSIIEGDPTVHLYRLILFLFTATLILGTTYKIRQLYRTLEDKKQNYLRLINWLDHAIIWEIDAISGKCLFVSQTTEYILKYPQSAWETKSFFILDIVHPEDKELFVKTMEATLAGPNDTNFEHRFVTSGGQIYWYHTGLHIDRKSGTPRILGISVDVHLLKQSEEELKSQHKLRNLFMNALTHDLRTPLAVIKLNLDLIEKKTNQDSIKDLFIRAKSNIVRMDTMIEDLLDSSLVQSGKTLTPTLEKIDALKIISECIDEYKLLYGDKFILNTRHQEVVGQWDKKYIRRAFENLLSNAVKYGFEHTPVTITVESPGSDLIIEVHNFGNVIDLQDQKLLFHQFARIKTEQTDRVRGWGIGLALVKGIVEAHQGTIEVHSAEEIGTRFRMTLPRQRTEFSENPIESLKKIS